MKNKLIALFLAAVMVIPLAFPATAADSEQDTIPLELQKSVSYNSSSDSYTINLETYSTGRTVLSESAVPTDIILVLDESGSMKYTMDGKETADNLTDVSMRNDISFGKDWEDYKNKLFFNPTGTNDYYKITLSTSLYQWQIYYHYSFSIGNTTYSVNGGTAAASAYKLSDKFKNDANISGRIGTGDLDSRREILQNTAKEFINDVKQDAIDNSVDHRIAVVGFSSDDSTRIYDGSTSHTSSWYVHNDKDYSSCLKSVNNETQYNSAIASIDALKAEGATYSQGGMEYAENILNKQQNDKRNKVVVFLSDGVPTKSNTFSKSVADGAIKASQTIKSTYGAKVYSIGIFSGADPTQFNNYISSNDESTENSNANRFMSLLSSNFPNAENMNNAGSGGSSTSGYYLAASTQVQLSELFDKITNESLVSATTLGEDAVVKDVVSQYFEIPSTTKVNDIKVQTVNCTGKSNGNYTFSNSAADLQGKTVKIEGNTVSVSGFDFQNDFCSGTPRIVNGKNYYGKKLVISFNVKAKEGFMGGNNVPTNDYVLNSSGVVENKPLSGIYQDKDAILPIATFNQPTANVKMNPQFGSSTYNVYAGNEFALTNSGIYATAQNQWVDDYVEITDLGAGGKSSYPLTDLTNAKSTLTVSPKFTDGSSSSGPKQTSKTQQISYSVNVFSPVIPCADTTIFLGDTADNYLLKNITNDKAKITWKHGSTLSTNVSMLSTEPQLSYDYDIIPGVFEEDTPVNVTTVTNGNSSVNIAFVAQFTNSNEQPANKEFTVHVNSGSIVLTKAFEGNAFDDSNETFVFKIEGSGNDLAKKVNLEVVVSKANLDKTITGLPKGNYTITEESGWSWRYDALNTGNVNITSKNSEQNVTIKNDLSDENWLNDFSEIDNLFNAKGQEVAQ